jgi:DNA-directed RNA polymerase specialized sigma24 family protein
MANGSRLDLARSGDEAAFADTCLNLTRKAARRPQMTQSLPAAAPVPTGSTEVTWLQPYPDKLLDGLPDGDPGPYARAERNEAVSLAFVTALQLLSPRGRAMLILRDVLGFTARETGDIIGSSEESVAVTLSRTRATLHQHAPSSEAPPARAGTPAEEGWPATWLGPWPRMTSTPW